MHATLIGPVAARALAEAGRGQDAHRIVRAVFERSLYLTLGETWCCVGPPGLGAGPLNILCEPWGEDFALKAHVALDDPVRLAAKTLYIGRRMAISLAAATEWRPQATAPWHIGNACRGLAIFEAALPPVLPAEGLACLIVPSGAESLASVATAALPAAQHLTACIVRSRAGHSGLVDADRIAPLLGLGPGLTPSGDDFLGGALIALALVGMTDMRDALWAAIAALARTHTTDISRAHLAAAADGFGSAAVHTWLDAVISARSDAMPQRIAAVAAIGHTSGWDALAGAVTVLRAASLSSPVDLARLATPGAAWQRL